MHPFIALTDAAWFSFLASRAVDGYVDEVNFWSPRATRPMKAMSPGEPIFFRLKQPHYAIAGYGFFAHFRLLGLDDAWQVFGWKNGDPDERRFLDRIGAYRGVDLLTPTAPRGQLGCTILRSACFWPRERWLAWGPEKGWAANIVQGKTETDPTRATQLLTEISADHSAVPEDFAAQFDLVDVDEREVVLARMRQREGQGAFRARLLDAYGARCAITGEHTEPVLDAAHIQPYLGPRSNHLQNGLLLTKEFHTLFDRGYVTVTPDRVVRVSPRLHQDWRNGRRYYAYDGQQLAHVPKTASAQPSASALAWHAEKVFLKTAS